MPPLFSQSIGRITSCSFSSSLLTIVTTPHRSSTELPLLLKSAACVVRPKRLASYEQKAKELNQKGINDQQSSFDHDIAQAKEKQARTPWHREGTAEPPVKRPRSAGAMTKGKLLTTPSRLLKLVLPLTTVDHNTDRKDIAPLALLVHPQQPLSYLERLIQSELPSITNEKGDNRIPKVSFRAVEFKDDEIKPQTQSTEEKDVSEPAPTRGGPGEGGVESYSGLGREAEDDDNHQADFVRWSSSTEIGDFIRDAARAKEFAVEIEGAPEDIRVGVPSFQDRTHYLRSRLKKRARQIADMSALKRECDIAAHKGGRRLAVGGFFGICSWWSCVAYLTFQTDLGWDVMEPITYLVGLTAVGLGYLYFLYNNREVSYRSALNFTISRRQSKLYEARGFDMARWEALADEANALRKEIKAVAAEYDVEWTEDELNVDDKDISNTLRKERQKVQSSRKSSSKDEDEEE